MWAFRDIGDEVRHTYGLRSGTVCTSHQVLTLKARLLQASRDVHRRLLSTADAESQPAWACRVDRLIRTRELFIPSNTDPES